MKKLSVRMGQLQLQMVASRTLHPKTDTAMITGVRIAELQVPAKALAHDISNKLIPEKYRNPYFDACALHPEGAQCFHFFLRFVRLEGTVLPFNLELTVIPQRLDGTNVDQITVTIVNLPKTTRAIDIWIHTEDKEHWKATTRLRHWNGELGKLEEHSTKVALIPDQLIGFTLNMQAPNTAELWADVSMLPSAQNLDKNQPDCFNFDWVFSSRGGKDNVAEAISTEELRAIREAAAQWVSLSPLIDSK